MGVKNYEESKSSENSNQSQSERYTQNQNDPLPFADFMKLSSHKREAFYYEALLKSKKEVETISTKLKEIEQNNSLQLTALKAILDDRTS